MDPSVAELQRTYAISDDQVDAAIDAFLAHPRTGRFAIADGYHLDLVAAVGRTKRTWEVATDPAALLEARRTAVHVAILAACPVRG